MPEAQRQECSISTPKGPIRATLHATGGNAARRPALALHRGIPSADEKAGDLLEAIVNAVSEAGMAALRFEPRTADLILADFNAYSVADETADLLAALNATAQHEAVDGARVSLLGFGLGAIATLAAARQVPSLNRVCLIAPAMGGDHVLRTVKGNGAPAPLRTEQLPDTWLAEAAQANAATSAADVVQPVLILHGAADRFIDAASSLPYAIAREAANLPVDRVLVARADHLFSSPAARQTCIERVVRFLTESAAPRPAPRPTAGTRA
jgi:alpha-beta hydrolase superfamily lysophospholipase